VTEGLAALEAMAAARAGRFLFGDAPTLADLCLIPQMYNARRFNVPTASFPLLVRIDEEANRLEPFAAAHPTESRRRPPRARTAGISFPKEQPRWAESMR
jgi:glutathione S-transferase